MKLLNRIKAHDLGIKFERCTDPSKYSITGKVKKFFADPYKRGFFTGAVAGALAILILTDDD